METATLQGNSLVHHEIQISVSIYSKLVAFKGLPLLRLSSLHGLELQSKTMSIGPLKRYLKQLMENHVPEGPLQFRENHKSRPQVLACPAFTLKLSHVDFVELDPTYGHTRPIREEKKED